MVIPRFPLSIRDKASGVISIASASDCWVIPSGIRDLIRSPISRISSLMETSYAKIGKIPISYPLLLVGELAHPVRINQKNSATTSVSSPSQHPTSCDTQPTDLPHAGDQPRTP